MAKDWECWSSNGTYNARARLNTDEFTGDRVEWSLATIAGATASINSTNGIVSFGNGGGQYRIRAESADLATCYDWMTLVVPNVDIQQTTTNVCKDCGCTVTMNVTTNSFSPGGYMWNSFPAGISKHGSSITFSPSNLPPGTYIISAQSISHPDCSDICTVNNIKVEVENCDSAFLPQGGSEDNTTTIRACASPSTVKGKLKFTLFDVSDEPGYCMNAPTNIPATGEDSDAGKDFQFPTQTGFAISGSDSNIAETVTNDLHEATVTIKSFDYGSFGKIKAEFTTQDGRLTCVAKEVGGTNEYTRLPADTNDNDIADSWSGDTGPSGTCDATYDDDNSPTNGYATGDGLSRYEEYRGFNVNGIHTRTSPSTKDVFICDVGNAFGSSRADVAQLGCDTHWITVNEWDGAGSDSSPTDQHINFNCQSHRARTFLQRALRLVDGGNNGTTTWGTFWFVTPKCPNNGIRAVVYTGNISTYWTNTPPASEVINRTVAHELAHGCGLTDDYSNPGGIMSEYLSAGSNVWHVFRSGSGAGTLNELRIRYP